MITYKMNRNGFNTLFNTMFAIVKTAPASFLVVEIRKHILRNAKCEIQKVLGMMPYSWFIPQFPNKKILSTVYSRCAKVLGTDALCYDLYDLHDLYLNTYLLIHWHFVCFAAAWLQNNFKPAEQTDWLNWLFYLNINNTWRRWVIECETGMSNVIWQFSR